MVMPLSIRCGLVRSQEPDLIDPLVGNGAESCDDLFSVHVRTPQVIQPSAPEGLDESQATRLHDPEEGDRLPRVRDRYILRLPALVRDQ